MGEPCDFCGRRDAHWRYPAREFQHDRDLVVGGVTQGGHIVVAEMGLHGIMEGNGWAACEGCHALIKRGDRDRLCLRAARRIAKSPEGMGMALNALLALIRPLQDQFWSNREGAPRRI